MSIEVLILAMVALGIVLAIAGVFMLLQRGRGSSEDLVSGAYLEDVGKITNKEKYPLSENKPTTLGRMVGKSRKLSYILIPEPTVGRHHAIVEFKEHAFWVSDQGSVNGTFVNNQKITQKERLKHGDVIRLHRAEFRFMMPELDEAGEKTVIASDLEMTQLAEPSPAAHSEAATGAAVDHELDFDADITLDNFIDDQTLTPATGGGKKS